jgi:hypothetical protein
MHFVASYYIRRYITLVIQIIKKVLKLRHPVTGCELRLYEFSLFLIFYILAVALRTTRFNVQKFFMVLALR